MRLGSTLRNRDFFPIAGVPISGLIFDLDLMVGSSGRNWHIGIWLIRVSARTGWLVGVAPRFTGHGGAPNLCMGEAQNDRTLRAPNAVSNNPSHCRRYADRHSPLALHTIKPYGNFDIFGAWPSPTCKTPRYYRRSFAAASGDRGVLTPFTMSHSISDASARKPRTFR
jgi:hypothetical protein